MAPPMTPIGWPLKWVRQMSTSAAAIAWAM